MLYAIAIGVLAVAVYWLWGIRKMRRMNNDPSQLVLAHLLVSAGSGNDEGLLAFIGQQRWTDLQVVDRVSHALTLAEKLFLSDEYLRAKAYARTVRDRYRAYQAGHLQEKRNEQQREADKAKVSANSAKRPPAPASPIANSATSQPAKQRAQRHAFEVNEFVVYPAHGVGQILAIEEQEIAGAKLELFVINFVKDKMTLRVPTAKVANVGMRRLSDLATIRKAYRELTQPPHVAEGDWSERAQEYEAKINSGDVIAIAQVVRDLYRPAGQREQSYSERQLYEAALDRLAREVAVVHITNEEAFKECESLVIAGAIGRRLGSPLKWMSNEKD